MQKTWSLSWLDWIKPTFLECWPIQLRALAPPQVGVALSSGEVRALIHTRPLWRPRLTADDPHELHALVERLDPLIAGYSAGAFVRLGSGSPKDSVLFGEIKGRARDAVTAIKLLQTSPRIRTHIEQCIAFGYAPQLFVRPWMEIAPEDEFRCFLRGRRSAGVSQAVCSGVTAPVVPKAARRHVEIRLRAFLDVVAREIHMDNAVLDVLCPVRDEGARPLLFDVNPWGARTGACLFSWQRPEMFDGRFLWVDA